MAENKLRLKQHTSQKRKQGILMKKLRENDANRDNNGLISSAEHGSEFLGVLSRFWQYFFVSNVKKSFRRIQKLISELRNTDIRVN